MKELDPTDLVHELNDQADLPGWPQRERAGQGGSVGVAYSDMLAPVGCWCGRDYGHDYLGKGDGAPHPRYPE